MDTLTEISGTLGLIGLAFILLGIYLAEPILYLLLILFRHKKSDSETAERSSRLSKGWLIAATVISLAFAALSFSNLIETYEQRKIDQTEAIASEVADRYFANLEANPKADMKAGTLEENYAWDHRLRLAVHQSVFGYGVEVYSDGPHGERDTSDDIMVSRFHSADGEEFSWNLVQTGKISIEDWIKGKSEILGPANEDDEVKIEHEIDGAKFSIKFGVQEKNE